MKGCGGGGGDDMKGGSLSSVPEPGARRSESSRHSLRITTATRPATAEARPLPTGPSHVLACTIALPTSLM